MIIFLSLRVTADAEGGLKNRAQLRPVLQGFGGGQPPTSKRRVYTGALLAATKSSHFTSLTYIPKWITYLFCVLAADSSFFKQDNSGI